MNGRATSDAESYEERVRRLRELEEQLSRERSALERMQSGKEGHHGEPSGSKARTPPAQFRTVSSVGSPPPADDPLDLLRDRRGYGENLTLPDDGLDKEDVSMPSQGFPGDASDDLPGPDLNGWGGLHPVDDRDDRDDWRSTDSIDPRRKPDPLDFIEPPGTHESPAGMYPGETGEDPRPVRSRAVPTPLNEIDQYRRDIEDFRARGYNVSRMYDIFTRDVETIREAVLKYMQDVNQLKEIENELEELGTAGYEDDVLSLNALLKDPDSLEQAKAFLSRLKLSLGKREEKRRLQTVREIEELFDQIMIEYSDVIGQFARTIDEIKASIIDLEMTSGSDAHQVKKLIYELKDSLVRARLTREREGEVETIREELRELKRKGFRVEEIEDLLSRNMKLATDLYDEFSSNASRLLEIEAELATLPSRGFEKEIAEIRSMLRDTDKVLLVQNRLTSLKRRIRLAGIKTKMNRIRTPADGKRTGPTRMTCPKCGGTVPISSDERPLKVNCSACGTEYHLKRVPVQEERSSAPASPADPSRPPVPGPPPGPDTCPKCGSALLPDSVFCGICGHRMS